MLVGLLYFLFIKIQLMTCQFPTHVDFQKIGEVSFNDEVYKVLKPQQHIIESRDALRRENTFPKEGILIDTSGRIHYWKGLIDSSDKSEQEKRNSENLPLKSLVEYFRDQSKKNDDAKGSKPEEEVNHNGFDTKLIDDIMKKALDPKDINKSIENKAHDLKSKIENNYDKKDTKLRESFDPGIDKNKNDTDIISEENITLKSIDETDPNDKTLNEPDDTKGDKENASENNDLQDETENLEYETTTDVPEEHSTTIKKRKKKEKKEIIPPNTVYIPQPLRQSKGKTVVKTTFFCPFLGIITMSSLIDI